MFLLGSHNLDISCYTFHVVDTYNNLLSTLNNMLTESWGDLMMNYIKMLWDKLYSYCVDFFHR